MTVNTVDHGGDTAVLHIELKDCNRGDVDGSVAVSGPEDMVLGALSLMISAVAKHLGRTYRELHQALSPPINDEGSSNAEKSSCHRCGAELPSAGEASVTVYNPSFKVKYKVCKRCAMQVRLFLERRVPEESTDEDGICPVCGAKIEYCGDQEIADDGTLVSFSCPQCGAHGKAGYDLVFDAYYDVQKGDGGNDEGK